MNNKLFTVRCISIFVLLATVSFTSRGDCELYNLDFINNQLSGPTYSVTCATNVTPSQWQVRSDTCSLVTSSIIIPGVAGTTVVTPVAARINRSGNLECGDWFKLEYSVNGVWFTVDSVGACDMSSNVQDYNFNVTCGALSSVDIRVTFSNNGGTPEKWFLKDGDLCISNPITLMPIELISFNAAVDNNRVKLFWSTASEKNNDYFTVERSQNGDSYQKVTVIDGAGNSNTRQDYTAYDNNPIFGTSYYRLKQTDFSGEYDYSDVVSVSVNFSSSSCNFRVVPNPCMPQCSVNMHGCQEQNISVALVDALGNQVYSDIPLSEGNQSFTIDPRNNLKPGVYILVGKGKKEKPNQRIVVQ